jgi:hypothetical protein
VYDETIYNSCARAHFAGCTYLRHIILALNTVYGTPPVSYATPQVINVTHQVSYAKPQVSYATPPVSYATPQVS